MRSNYKCKMLISEILNSSECKIYNLFFLAHFILILASCETRQDELQYFCSACQLSSRSVNKDPQFHINQHCVCVHGEVMLDHQQKQEGKKKHRNRELKVASSPDLGKKVQANHKERLNKTKPSKQNLKFLFRNFGLNFNVVIFFFKIVQ